MLIFTYTKPINLAKLSLISLAYCSSSLCPSLSLLSLKMTPNSIVFFVFFFAFNIHCESFAIQTKISKLASSVRSTAASRSSPMMMTSTESVSDQEQLGRVTMYKKEGQSFKKLLFLISIVLHKSWGISSYPWLGWFDFHFTIQVLHFRSVVNNFSKIISVWTSYITLLWHFVGIRFFLCKIELLEKRH